MEDGPRVHRPCLMIRILKVSLIISFGVHYPRLSPANKGKLAFRPHTGTARLEMKKLHSFDNNLGLQVKGAMEKCPLMRNFLLVVNILFALDFSSPAAIARQASILTGLCDALVVGRLFRLLSLLYQYIFSTCLTLFSLCALKISKSSRVTRTHNKKEGRKKEIG